MVSVSRWASAPHFGQATLRQAAAASPEVLERLARELRGLADFVATRAAEAVQ